MTNEIIANVAAKMYDFDLMRVSRVLEAELVASIKIGERGTQAHIGRIELASACSRELWSRGYEKGRKRDGSDIPHLVCVEDGIRYQNAVMCY